MVYTAEKALTDMGDKLEESEKEDIKTSVEALKEALKGENIDDIKTKREELEKKFYAVSEKIYKAAAEEAQANAANNGTEAKPEDNVYEADFKDADENKN